MIITAAIALTLVTVALLVAAIAVGASHAVVGQLFEADLRASAATERPAVRRRRPARRRAAVRARQPLAA